MRPIITLTTDFGLGDAFVGIMKGVILKIAPDAQCVDITHNIEPQNIVQASLMLESASHWFPEGTVHLVVVDPGVGGSRKPIAIESGGQLYVGPDNGILTSVLEEGEVFELTNNEYFLHPLSATFHGRDLFAPVAAWLARGVPLEQMGIPLDDPVTLDLPEPQIENNTVVGEVIHIDRFGNLITNISETHVESCFQSLNGLIVQVGETEIAGISPSYEAIAAGDIGAIINSWNHLEIFQCKGNAMDELQSGLQTTVSIWQAS